MIIITDTIFKKTLKPFITWKIQKGFRITTLYRGSGLAGTSFAELKDTLQKIYNSENAKGIAPDYLLIVGDVNRIPVSEAVSNTTDLYYSTFDGPGDYLPELFTGRLPVADTTELKSVINKLIQYEKFEFADSNRFYSRTLASAGDDGLYADYMNGQLRYAEKYYLNPSNKINNHIFYYDQSASARDFIIKLFNSGLGFVNYSGHGDAEGWLSPSFKSADVLQLTNKNMYPFVISNACRTGQYSIPGSFGNTLLKSADKGAVGFIGCSNDSYWSEDFYWTVGTGVVSADPKYEETGLGAYDRLFHRSGEKASDWYVTAGQINYAGNLSVMASTSSKKKYNREIYKQMRDPTMIPYKVSPYTFLISLPDTLPNGIRSFSMTIDPFAYIAISHFDTLWDASYASPSGAVTLEIPGISNDSCLIVVSGQNMIPVIKKVYISTINREYINLTNASVNDMAGNNDGIADYGENIALALNVSNLGLTPAGGLYAKVTSSSSEWFTIISDSVYIGTLKEQTDTLLDNQIIIKINELVPDRSVITLNVKLKDHLTEKNYTVDIALHAPSLKILNCVIDDSAFGNGNHMADPGESLNLDVRILNSGSSAASGTLYVTNTPEGVTVHNYSTATGIIMPGEIKSVLIPVTVSPLTVKGSQFEISFMADCDPYFANNLFSISVGANRESFEYQTFTMLPWINNFSNPWTITSGEASEGYYSARSGVISHNSESKLAIIVNVPYPDSVTFMYKVSSEKNWDLLIFLVNGVQKFVASGDTGWILAKAAVEEGFNLLEWIYRKDVTVTSGSDCAWLDNLVFPINALNRTDLKAAKIISPDIGKKLGMETISAEVINLGTDTVRQFNMAYQVNINTPVTQLFNNEIKPGDTAIVSFTTPANLSFNGLYNLKIYGFGNNDSYLLNDTAKLTIINTAVEKINIPGQFIKIMPNPFSDRFRISFDANSFDDVRFTIINLTGVSVWEEKREIVPGENNITITPGSLAPGYYTLIIRGKTIFSSSGIIKSQ